MKRIAIALSSAILLLAINGCVPYEKLVNYKEDPIPTNPGKIENAPSIRIQPGDVLRIKVYSPDEKTAAPFNLTPVSQGDDFVSIEAIQLSGYLVDGFGTIDFPVVGVMELSGKTISEAKDMIRDRLLEYLKEPVVNVRLLNFRVTVSGEVRRPGSFFVVNERITIPEALTLAGDLTDYADRSNILVVRETDGTRTFHKLNLQSAKVFRSDYFYLKQNDLIYVEPIQAKTGAVEDQATKSLPFITAAAALLAVVISIANN